MLKSALAAGAFIALAAIGANTTAAEAGGKHAIHIGGYNSFYGISHRPRLRIVIGDRFGYGGYGYSYGSGFSYGEVSRCGYFYDKWLVTGRLIWKKKYLLCRELY